MNFNMYTKIKHSKIYKYIITIGIFALLCIIFSINMLRLSLCNNIYSEAISNNLKISSLGIVLISLFATICFTQQFIQYYNMINHISMDFCNGYVNRLSTFKSESEDPDNIFEEFRLFHTRTLQAYVREYFKDNVLETSTVIDVLMISCKPFTNISYERFKLACKKE